MSDRKRRKGGKTKKGSKRKRGSSRGEATTSERGPGRVTTRGRAGPSGTEGRGGSTTEIATEGSSRSSADSDRTTISAQRVPPFIIRNRSYVTQLDAPNEQDMLDIENITDTVDLPVMPDLQLPPHTSQTQEIDITSPIQHHFSPPKEIVVSPRQHLLELANQFRQNRHNRFVENEPIRPEDFGPPIADIDMIEVGQHQPLEQRQLDFANQMLYGSHMALSNQNISGSLANSPKGNAQGMEVDLPGDVVYHYQMRTDQIENIDENDMRTLCFHSPQYLIEYTLHLGKFGTVFVAQQLTNSGGRDVAVKKVTQGQRASTLHSMQRERQIIEAIIRHPHQNVLTFYEIIQSFDDSRNLRSMYFVSELSLIGNLFELNLDEHEINEQGIEVWDPIGESLARHLIKGIAKGVRHLKTLNICHADINLTNVLLFPNQTNLPINEKLDETRFDKWTVKLIGFTNSQRTKQTDPHGKILFNYPTTAVPYASPESLKHTPDGRYQICDGYASDVFSVGILLLSLLTGSVPFTPDAHLKPSFGDPEYVAKLKKYMIFVISLKSDTNYLKHLIKNFSIPLKQLLLKVLNPNPDHRITIDQFLTDPWITTQRRFRTEALPDVVSGYYGIKTPKLPKYSSDI